MRKVLLSMSLAAQPLLFAAQPKYHTLVITTKDGKLPFRVGDFVERKFPAIYWKNQSALEFYKAKPQIPLAACAEAEYYLLGPAGELLRKGCLEINAPTAAAWEIENALREFQARMGKANPP